MKNSQLKSKKRLYNESDQDQTTRVDTRRLKLQDVGESVIQAIATNNAPTRPCALIKTLIKSP